MYCTRLAGNAGPKKSPKIRHLGTIAQLYRAIYLQLNRLIQLKQNNAKQFQNKTKTICFGFVSALCTCETKR